jgi:hypothetical protein
MCEYSFPHGTTQSADRHPVGSHFLQTRLSTRGFDSLHRVRDSSDPGIVSQSPFSNSPTR